MRALGRRAPKDWEHVEKYPLAARGIGTFPRNVPVVLGINWYSLFDDPQYDQRGFWYIDPTRRLGAIRGGHAICCEPKGGQDGTPWWEFYNQGEEGACVGFSSSRMMTLLNRKRYDATWLYNEAKKNDEWDGEDYEGTTVRAAMDVLRTEGHRPYLAGQTRPLDLQEGISANRWATRVEQLLAVLGTPDSEFLTLLNSWGRDYPHRVRINKAIVQRLLDEDGEATLVTDR
jgi:hypothetical protein